MFGYRDVRTFKTLKAKLLGWPSAVYVEGGWLKNPRVEREVSEVAARKSAAAEGRRRQARSERDRQEIDERSAEDRTESGARSTPEVSTISTRAISNPNNLSRLSPSPSPSPLEEEGERLEAPTRDVPHMDGGTFVISHRHGLSIPAATVEQWRERYPDLPDLEAKLVRLGSVILARGHCHPGWTCPKGWMAGCLGEDNAKARSAKPARHQSAPRDPARTSEFYALFAELEHDDGRRPHH